MSETSPYSIDIAKIRNILLSSVSSRLNCYGNDEVQLEILDSSRQMNYLTNGFNMESNSDSDLGQGVYTQPSQSQSLIYDYNHHSDLTHTWTGNLYAIPSSKHISQQSLLLDKDPSLSQYEGVCGNGRKCPFEYIDNISLWEKMKRNSESKITIMEPKWYQAKEPLEIIPPHNLHVPMRRNQKLSDRVTTLQKLVSPFGKTDPASVLHEASLYIKLLQAQIQMLSFSYTSTIKDTHTQECGDKLQVDLRSKGFCVVPISITEKVTMVDQIHHTSATRIIHSQNF